MLTAKVLELLIRANHFEPEGHGDEIVFGLRGGRLASGDRFEDVDAIAVIDTRPDHATFCCTIGTLSRKTGKLRAFTASTVPNKHYMQNYYRKQNGIRPYKDIDCNILPTGCYIFRVGAHAGGSIRPALRMTEPDKLTADAVCTVLRTSNDLAYKHDDFWDPATPYDNIHCAYFDNKFSSAGCQTIKGGNGEGPWGRFQSFLSRHPLNTRFNYVLLTGREAAIAAQIITGGRASDAGLVRACLERLRVGSEGEAVTRLQKKLGFSGTAYFGPSTKKRLTERQREKGVASDGVYSPELDAAFGWDVFEVSHSSTVPSRPGTSTGGLNPSTLHFLAPDRDHQLSEDRRQLVIPGEGAWQVTDSGAVTFTPVEGFVGQTSPIRYAISDASGAITTRTVRVEVKPTNKPPQLRADKVQTNEGEPVLIDVLANDVGVDGKLQPSSLIFVDPSENAGLSSDGRMMDVPEGQWRIDRQSGIVTFSPAIGVRDRRVTAHYQVADDRGTIARAEIVVIVTRPNDAPLAATTSAGQAVTIDVVR